jgi:hypothetical protein
VWNRGLIVAAVLVLAIAMAEGVAGASTQSNWAAGIQAMLPGDAASNPNVSASSVSCPSVGSCTTVGSYNIDPTHTQAVVFTETSGTWGPGIKVALPAGAASGGLDSVSCPSTGNCTAVGLYTDGSGHLFGLIATETSGTWAPAIQAPLPSNAASPNPSALLSSVSCPSAGNCAAVGNYNHDSGTHGLLLTETGGTWSAQEATLPAGALANPVASLISVSCPAAGSCGAVGTYLDAGGYQAVLLSEASGTWGQGVKATLPSPASSPGVSMSSVSCPAPGDCSAGGGFLDSANHHEGVLLNESSGTWAPGVAVTLPTGAATDPLVNVLSVSCPAVGECSAVGNYEDNAGHFQGLLLTESSGTWAAGMEAVLPSNAGNQGPHFAIRSVSCASAGDCDAVGNYTDGSSVSQGVFLTESSGIWGSGVEATFPTQSTNQGAFLNAVSCATGAACSAAGGYSASSGNSQGALFSTAPAAPTLSVAAPATGSTTAAISPASVSATLASGMSPVGTISFRVFGPQASPPTSCGSGGTTLGSATVAGNGTYHPAAGFTPPGAGDYWWYASYGGDASDNTAASSCGPSMAKTVVPGPVVSKFRQSHRRWREAGKKPPVGTTFSFKLSESATVTLAFSKHVPGRRVKHRCVAPTKHNRHRPSCTRRVAAGKLKLSEHAGQDKIRFLGVVAHRHRLRPGVYTVTIIAKNASGSSAPKNLTFTIVA